MPQVFSKSSNVYSKASIPGIGGLLLTLVLIGMYVTPYTHRIGVAISQNIPFSHKHHVTELGIDCRYCHTTVEKTGFAGIPPTETCYTCHSQIWTNSPLLQPVRDSYDKKVPLEWNRVHSAPKFVYFDHSIHVAKGVSCFTCHGKINEMNLVFKANAMEMLWCLDCHREPEINVRPKGEVFNADYKEPSDQMELGRRLVKEYGIHKEQLTNCWICHR